MESVINSIDSFEQLEAVKILLKAKKTQLRLIKNKSIIDKISEEPYHGNDLDIDMWTNIGGNKRLIQKDSGVYWVFEFDDNKILHKLYRRSDVFIRTDSRSVGGFPDIEEDPVARFYSLTSKGKIEIIILYDVYFDRTDGVVCSGLRSYGFEMKNEDNIAWKTPSDIKS